MGGRGVRGFPAIEGRRARVLVLGTMPGERSLRAREYYAHPRNCFWTAVGEGREVAYSVRCRRLRARGIAVWDVLDRCVREGSLDAAIRAARPNDFAAFHRRHPELSAILFNGTKARDLFDRLVPPLPGVRLRTLPSTSPANTDRRKAGVWRRALRAAR